MAFNVFIFYPKITIYAVYENLLPMQYIYILYIHRSYNSSYKAQVNSSKPFLL